MEAALAQLEEYSNQLVEVEEALRLDPTNAALQELLTEIAAGIAAAEAQIASQEDIASIITNANDLTHASSSDSESDNDRSVSSASSESDDEEQSTDMHDLALTKPATSSLTPGVLGGNWTRALLGTDEKADEEAYNLSFARV